MVTVEAILEQASLKYEPYERAGRLPVYLSRGHQLFGSYATLKKFRSGNQDYHGWQAHHVFETQDLAACISASGRRESTISFAYYFRSVHTLEESIACFGGKRLSVAS